jgi:hypothetical protein
MNRDDQLRKACMDRIKDLLKEWARWNELHSPLDYPRQSNFVTERVQSSNRSTDSYVEMPTLVSKLDSEIERMAPLSKNIIRLEFLSKGPQKLKCEQVNLSRDDFSRRLGFIYEHLYHAVFDN